MSEMLIQAGAFLVVLIALGMLGLSLLGGWRRLGREQEVHALEIATFKARLTTAQVEQNARESEGLTWNGYRKFRVREKRPEGGGICSFYLEPHDGKPTPGFRPGQYLTFSLKIPGETRPVVRCYSLSDCAREDYYRVSIKRQPAPRGKPELPPGRSSSFFHDMVHENSIVDVKAPRGDFFLDLASEGPVVLIGGGVGLTPMVSMLEAIAERDFDREVWFFYGVRNAEEHVMADRFVELAKRAPEKFQMHIFYSDPGDAGLPTADPIHFHEGRVSVEAFKELLPSSNYHYYICGPPPMMEAVTHDLKEWKVPTEHVHFELFGPASVKKTAKVEAIGSSAAQKFKISFERSGKDIEWDLEIGSILDFAEANDITIDSGCRAGSCGTCLTAIKSGEVEYLADPSVDPDAGSCLACIAVPKSDLVLDA